MNKYTPTVKRGIKWLEENIIDPKINIKKLDLFYCDTCILGQLFGDYYMGMESVI